MKMENLYGLHSAAARAADGDNDKNLIYCSV
jgi:hypothetical protein